MTQISKSAVIKGALQKTDSYNPVYNGAVRITDKNEKERVKLIIYALSNYSFLLDTCQLYRLCYLAQEIRKYYDCVSNERNKLLTDILIVNSFYYTPFYINRERKIFIL